MMLLALVVAATAVAAVPVERTNGVLSTVYRDDFKLSDNNQHHFIAFNRGCHGCRGGFVPNPFAHRYPYHLTDTYEERGLVKRSPKLGPIPIPLGDIKKKLLKHFPLFWLSPVAG